MRRTSEPPPPRLPLAVTLVVSGFLFACSGGSKTDRDDGAVTAHSTTFDPFITTFGGDTDNLAEGESTELEVGIAAPPDTLYHLFWDSDCGLVIPRPDNQKVASFWAPEQPGTCTVTITIRDDEMKRAASESYQKLVPNTCTTPAQPDKPTTHPGDPPIDPNDKSCKRTTTGCDKPYRDCCFKKVLALQKPPGQEDCNHSCWAKHKAADKSSDKSRSWNGCLAYCSSVIDPLSADCLEKSGCYQQRGTSPATMRCRARLNGKRASCLFSADCEVSQKWRDAFNACNKLR